MIGKYINSLSVFLLAALGQSATALAQPATQPTTSASQVVVVASVEAFWTADQYAKTSGYVAEVKADIGDRVKKGQVLAIIDAPELERDLATAEATLTAKRQLAKASQAMIKQAEAALEVAGKQLAGWKADLEVAEATLKRQQQLFENKAATDQQLDDARAKTTIVRTNTQVAQARIASAEADIATATANSAVAQAQVEVAAAELEKIRTMILYTRITAPFDGVITRRMASPGDLVQAATASRTTPLFTTQQMDTVRVFCSVPEASAAGIREGTAAEVSLYGAAGQVIRGTVTRVAGSLDAATRTMRAEIDLPNPDGKLRPGMYAQVTLTRSAP